jgi:hypothetical protein
MKKVGVLFVGVALTLVVFLMHTRMQVRDVQRELNRLEELLAACSTPDLVADMGRLQVYMEKLWYAGEAMNHDLVKFYRHEIEEVLEDLAAAEITEDGHDVSLRIRQMALPVIEAWETRGQDSDVEAFETSYLELMNACNTCHQVTDHGYIRVARPVMGMPINQLFSLN